MGSLCCCLSSGSPSASRSAYSNSLASRSLFSDRDRWDDWRLNNLDRERGRLNDKPILGMPLAAIKQLRGEDRDSELKESLLDNGETDSATGLSVNSSGFFDSSLLMAQQRFHSASSRIESQRAALNQEEQIKLDREVNALAEKLADLEKEMQKSEAEYESDQNAAQANGGRMVRSEEASQYSPALNGRSDENENENLSSDGLDVDASDELTLSPEELEGILKDE